MDHISSALQREQQITSKRILVLLLFLILLAKIPAVQATYRATAMVESRARQLRPISLSRS